MECSQCSAHAHRGENAHETVTQHLFCRLATISGWEGKPLFTKEDVQREVYTPWSGKNVAGDNGRPKFSVVQQMINDTNALYMEAKAVDDKAERDRNIAMGTALADNILSCVVAGAEIDNAAGGLAMNK